MKKILMTCLMLTLALPGLVGAQTDEAAAEAEEKAAREALRQELQEARREVAEAARELARIQRELADEERLSEMLRENVGDIRGRRIERIELHDADGLLRPRIGLGYGPENGATVVDYVTPGSGAERAGIKSGDTLLSINGQEIDAYDPDKVFASMDGVETGDLVPVVIERHGQRMEFEVEASTPARNIHVITHDIRGPHRVPPAPDSPDAPNAPHIEREVIVLRGDEHAPPMARIPPMPPLPRLAGLGRHTDMVSNHAGLEPYFGTAEGVVVLRIDADNPLKLRDGDVVLSIDGEAVSRPVDIGRALFGQGGQSVTLEVMRDGERVTLEADLPESEALSLFIPHAPGAH